MQFHRVSPWPAWWGASQQAGVTLKQELKAYIRKTANWEQYMLLKSQSPCAYWHTPSNKVTPPNPFQMVLSSRYPDIQRDKSVRGPFSFKPPQHANLQGNIWSIIMWDKRPAEYLIIKKYPVCICSVFIQIFSGITLSPISWELCMSIYSNFMS